MKTKVWDLPIRLFHIGIIVLVGISWWSGERLDRTELAGLDPLDIHIWSGCTILALVLFRILWGFVGSTTARFSHFVKGPVAVARYLRGMVSRQSRQEAGHNPLGGWSVVLMLAMLLAMPLMGLFAADADLWGAGPSGPLSSLVQEDTADNLAHWHEDLWEILMIVLGVHIAAALFYLVVKRQNLIGAMITGRANVEGAETLRFRPLWLAVLILAVTGGAVVAAITTLA
ncbi:cytochrome b/b6 domain-containing protein [Iodidimonas sp. SYSU 1G8]|uniref:cytochrome b/b6 domain-containing protein n=1 Tax=Iodidimonas sp. SYSU 1G8 TaxID=3133967 RepID=UPI0031FEC822